MANSWRFQFNVNLNVITLIQLWWNSHHSPMITFRHICKSFVAFLNESHILFCWFINYTSPEMLNIASENILMIINVLVKHVSVMWTVVNFWEHSGMFRVRTVQDYGVLSRAWSMSNYFESAVKLKAVISWLLSMDWTFSIASLQWSPASHFVYHQSAVMLMIQSTYIKLSVLYDIFNNNACCHRQW